MTRAGQPLRALAALFQGELPEEAEWSRIIDLANRAWLTPAVHVALEKHGRLAEIPDAVRDYIAVLHERNVERNGRLRSQLIEALGALNRASIEPILLKGAVSLFVGDEAKVGSRMISDLDISIEPYQAAAAAAALRNIGYGATDNPREFARTIDVGVVEFHDRPNFRSERYLSGDLRQSAPLIEREGVSAHVPTATARALHLIVHDMIKEGDYWRFRINLRHLRDLVDLSASSEGIDWDAVSGALPDRVGRGALAMQLNALQNLFSVETPANLRRGAGARLRHSARIAATDEGLASAPIRLAGRILWGARRFRDSYSRRGAKDFAGRVRRNLVEPTKGSTV